MDYCCYFGLPQVNNESESEGTEIEPLILNFFSFSFYFLSYKMKSFEILGEGMVGKLCLVSHRCQFKSYNLMVSWLCPLVFAHYGTLYGGQYGN